ncbi:bark agglutinin lecrpa3-like protein [Trifolium pratense]|uniref:Bark agglutinin lecrpa3-like protein n=1 Tax=Trifolium pratense TaxID=57577 RepID=A0A2K3MK51_TRIPR|nr:bark agglutinin lecrpa3-like protein [Trifolium pratense]
MILLAKEVVNSQKTTSFSISNFSADKSSIILQGSAKISSSGTLALTDPNDKLIVGHALYTTPVSIWDSSTGNVVSFITSFSFILDNFGTTTPADGLVFFLAPTNTQIPNNSTGGKLGLVDESFAFNQFVGVEFDNYVNTWDPKYSHIGINVNSLMSLKTATWNRVNHALVSVSIAYDSNSKILSVVLTDNNGQLSTVAHVVDFKEVLPETVRIGFSASTSGPSRQVHTIQSWSFSSVLI